MLMKEGLGAAAIERIAAAFQVLIPHFDGDEFVQMANLSVVELELKQRVAALIAVIHRFVPHDFHECAEIFRRFPDVWHRGDASDPLRGFAAWPVIDYVAHYGIEQPDVALPLLQRLTPLFSAEFAIRPFIQRYPEFVVPILREWCESDDAHVRRLASEGSRPRLPWGIRLTQFVEDPLPLWSILNELITDPSDYVRRSVANSLNDISKDHPDLVIQWCDAWLANGRCETQWIVRHATRSLVKNGYPEAFRLLGYNPAPSCKVEDLTLVKERIQLGESLDFSLSVVASDQHEKLVVDYVIYHVKANGSLTPKVFKLKQITLKPNQQQRLTKKHPFRQITTRQYYAGQHWLAIQINGIEMVKRSFSLELASPS